MTTSEASRSPYFIVPQSLADMDDDALDAFLRDVRERRLRAAKEMQEAEKLKQEAKKEKIEAKLSKQLEMFGKEIAQLDKVIAKLEKRKTNIQAIRIELGVEVDL